ncbi:probable phytanoyl-CoA dioxygenase [Manduca sexta]|uniref:probable phytanoyl-CoA dioxygenase n=1 Tax=Manduca sexta TaxID=7130 RepID=UPI001183A3D0|nr:probable phytanoyl-CoA dioxygenase [Manduca sexta]
MPHSLTLSEEQKTFYDRNGYIVIRGLIELPLLEAYKKRFSELCHKSQLSATIIKEYSLVGKKQNPEDYIYKIQDILFDPVYMTYSEHPDVLNVVSQLIGDQLTAVNLMLINKPPETTRHPTHQDLFYFPFRPAEKIIGVWTAVDAATVQNGCLFVVPGSHKCNQLLKHGTFKDSKKFFHCLEDEDNLAPAQKRMNLEMQPGDTVFFHPYLFHGSGPNLSESYRKALTIHYAHNACYYIDLRGTVQEQLAADFDEEMRRRGHESVTFVDLWKLKSKDLGKIKSHL